MEDISSVFSARCVCVWLGKVWCFISPDLPPDTHNKLPGWSKQIPVRLIGRPSATQRESIVCADETAVLDS